MLLVEEGQRPPLRTNLPTAALPRAAGVPAEPPAARARFLRPGFVDIEHSPIEFAPTERRDCALSFSIIAHLDKSKAPGPSGFTVRPEVYAVNSPVRLEHGSKRVFSGPEAEVSHKHVLQLHFFLRSTEPENEAQDRAAFRTMQTVQDWRTVNLPLL